MTHRKVTNYVRGFAPAPSDNRIENLELWSSRHGPGQRIADKLEHAREIMARYSTVPMIATIPEAAFVQWATEHSGR